MKRQEELTRAIQERLALTVKKAEQAPAPPAPPAPAVPDVPPSLARAEPATPIVQ